MKRTAPKVFLDYKNTQNTTERNIGMLLEVNKVIIEIDELIGW